MSKGMVSAAGGLSAADREKLIPENVREGVVLFAGTPREVVGTLIPAPETGSFIGFSGGVVSEMLGSVGGGAKVVGTVIRYTNTSGVSGIGWFTNILDMSRYSSIIFLTGGLPWEEYRNWTVGVGCTTNSGEYLAKVTKSIRHEEGVLTAIQLDVSNVNEMCFLKWETNSAISQYISKVEISV